MTAPRGVRYFSPGDISGYGQAAIANVRALLNVGIPVQWIPLDWKPDRMHVGNWATLPNGQPRPLLRQSGVSGHLSDIRALLEKTAAPIDHDVVVAHSPTEFWPHGFEQGKRNIGCVAWETDRTPAHWLPLMRPANRIVVPSNHNRDALRRGGFGGPIDVIPHIRRHRWSEFSRGDLAAARADLGIPEHHRVFYTINAWTLRKALPELIRVFVDAFQKGEPVTLLIKTEPVGGSAGPLYPLAQTRDLAEQAIAAATLPGKPAPHILLLDQPLDADELDMIHAIGEVYVSLTHSEGWGLGAYEAAQFGKPVVMTAWGGQTDYLGTDWPGAVPYRMASVPIMPPNLPTYFPSQRWAQPDLGAAKDLLRHIYANPEPALAAARTIRERITDRCAEPTVAAHWLEVLDG